MILVDTFKTPKVIRFCLATLILLFGALSQTSWADDSKADVNAVKHLDAVAARQLLAENANILVLDVRTKGEYKRGHIEGAIRNNYFSTKFKKRLRLLDRNASYLVHCKSGHRSGRVVKIMQKEGFTNIYHLDGGYDAWKKLPPLSQHSK